MVTKNIFGLLFATIILAVSVVAQPSLQPPHWYYGTVTVDGQPAPDGLLVVAKVDGKDVAAGSTKDGGYGFDGDFYVTDPHGTRTGETVEFYIQNTDTGETTVFSNDESASSQVDLDASGVTTGTSTTSVLAGGGGGGGGGGGAALLNQEDERETLANEGCEPEWTCSDWLPCISGSQNRVCVDSNRCGSDSGKPELQRECEVSEELKTSQEERDLTNKPFDKDTVDLLDGEAKKSGMDKILGAVLGGGKGTWISLLVLVGIIGGLLFAFIRREKPPKQGPEQQFQQELQQWPPNQG